MCPRASADIVSGGLQRTISPHGQPGSDPHVAAARTRYFPHWPNKHFWADFWPAFWATAIGAVLSIPSALYVDRLVKRHAAAQVLPRICLELEQSEPALRTFAQLSRLPRDAVGIFGSPTRVIRTSFQGSFDKVDDGILVAAVSDAYASLDEVNRYLELYRSSYVESAGADPSFKTQIAEALLGNTSVDAIGRVKNAIRAINETRGTTTCQ